jgi:hypothetical protein
MHRLVRHFDHFLMRRASLKLAPLFAAAKATVERLKLNVKAKFVTGVSLHRLKG